MEDRVNLEKKNKKFKTEFEIMINIDFQKCLL